MGWFASDGINAGQYGTVSYSFIRVNDDGVKPFYSGSEFKNLVIWQMKNGWAIMLAWTTEGEQDGIYVHDISILHDDHSECTDPGFVGCDYAVAPPDNPPPNYIETSSQATIGADQGGGGKITNVLVKDVTVETKAYRPFFLGVQENYWGDSGTGILDTWTFENIAFWEDPMTTSKILGGPMNWYQVNNIKFINVRYDDQEPLKEPWDANYFDYTLRDVGSIFFCPNESCPSFGGTKTEKKAKARKSKKGKVSKGDKMGKKKKKEDTLRN
mmetsp:Transcript_18554/g.27516  ORF Transcript_18554/g.27516 Transcript_18554/m.27516 type:complete len:270 (-) Transcript_18554:371-1180(-)|eukprot:CAMPEP_0194224878 /NCGR_PEP_ID=MMETSP0156-20130528/38378_1 /TAXON_ID=33649 /ORGANISM="Thalassionema nitzschioides, Strain L26-B" /LENGTH=269 /DNA_ID=CAMNT_0038956611 /DNA_START=334 /DNA_END=1143 /DNA_ORIENTATION=+